MKFIIYIRSTKLLHPSRQLFMYCYTVYLKKYAGLPCIFFWYLIYKYINFSIDVYEVSLLHNS